MTAPDPRRCDVAVIGGAFAGASTAILLRRWLPEARVVVIERTAEFDRKVGESTVEISSLFLHKALGVTDLLSRGHLPKHGFRFWFHERPSTRLEEMTELGPREVPTVPAYQIDRSRLDERLLGAAAEAGAETWRPARVRDVELGWPESRLEVEEADGQRRSLTARWIVDASGRHAFLARRLRLRRRVEEHPTAAAWARWRGVRDLDAPEVRGSDPRRPRLPSTTPSRRLATNHFCGLGRWCWTIPLRGGETSVGVVYDKRLFELPEGPDLETRYRRFVTTAPGLSELLDGAEMEEGDFRAYSHLPYRTERYMDRGWAMVGDAAAFLDPYYSPGLDHAAFSVYATAALVRRHLRGELDDEELTAVIAEHNDRFERSYDRWMDAIYLDKYELLGDAELAGAAFMMDTALYYLGIVTPVVEEIDELATPIFSENIPPVKLAYAFIRFYRSRLGKLARKRRADGTYGRRNEGWRLGVRTARVGPTGFLAMFLSGMRVWLRAELSRLWPVSRRTASGSEASRAVASSS